MVSGSNLRGSFNLHMRSLYKHDKGEGSTSGASGTTKINSKGYVDNFINTSYDKISEYENLEKLSEDQLLDFIEEINNTIRYYLEYDLNHELKSKFKEYFKDYTDDISKDYSEKTLKKIQKIHENLSSFNPISLQEQLRKSWGTSKKKKQEKTSGSYSKKSSDISQDYVVTEKRKKQQYHNPTEEETNQRFQKKKHKKVKSHTYNVESKEVKYKPEEGKKSLPWGKICLFLLLLVIVYMGFQSYQNYKLNQPIENTTIENDSLEIPEIPKAPILEEYKFSQVEQQLLNAINQKRVQYGKEEFNINLDLSEVTKDYHYILLDVGEDQAKLQVGDLVQRTEKVDDQIKNIRESKHQISKEGISSGADLLGKLNILDLYQPKYTGIAISIIEQESEYNIIVDIFEE